MPQRPPQIRRVVHVGGGKVVRMSQKLTMIRNYVAHRITATALLPRPPQPRRYRRLLVVGHKPLARMSSQALISRMLKRRSLPIRNTGISPRRTIRRTVVTWQRSISATSEIVRMGFKLLVLIPPEFF